MLEEWERVASVVEQDKPNPIRQVEGVRAKCYRQFSYSHVAMACFYDSKICEGIPFTSFLYAVDHEYMFR